jgi:predicted lipoprotein
MKTPSKLPLYALLSLALLAALSGCDRKQRMAEQAAAQAAIAEDAAKQAEAAFDAAVAQQNWQLAKAQADVLLAQYPQSQAAARVRTQFDAVAGKAEAAREQSRTAALWSYNREPVKGGIQLSASI